MTYPRSQSSDLPLLLQSWYQIGMAGLRSGNCCGGLERGALSMSSKNQEVILSTLLFSKAPIKMLCTPSSSLS